MAVNADTLLSTEGGRVIARDILDMEFLKNAQPKGALYQKTKTYGLAKSMPTKEGFYHRMTRKNHIRPPETDPITNGASSDPASGFNLLADQVLLPIESHRQYTDIDVMTGLISWIDVVAWAKEEMAQISWPRRANRLLQNALLNGRMTPGVIDANGAVTTAWDATAATSLTRYGVAFSFTAFPRVYAGSPDFATLTGAPKQLSWADIRDANQRLGLAGAIMHDGAEGPGFICALSRPQWVGLLMDLDGGRLTAAIAGGLKSAIEGLKGHSVFFYADTYFVIEDDPYTLNAGNEVARADWGDFHVAFMFGREAYGYTSLGSKGFSNFKIQDITKTGANYSIGARIHWNCRVVNENWGICLISQAGVSKPNNYSGTNKQLHGFGVNG